ncbi:spore photoproduct lyase family protein [Clostridium sp.]|jgi:spore photoproduct lyase|uniref:spore photoproduct lyase family protein n=1 Tax=Clostridium sp. TaxID=1506 RepID=UPI003EEFA0BC
MIKYQITKSLVTKPNNNSANAIAPNLIYGCFGGCVDTYCYMSRYNGHRVFVNSNVLEIVASVYEWAKNYVKVSDQQDPVYKMVDIACNTDLVLMQKHCIIPLIDYLKMYDDHSEINSTMATKYPGLLKLDVNHFNKKPRVRVSLMPQSYSNILEPKMQSIESRINDINRLKKLGWEVHINYSPVILFKDFKNKYKELFNMVNDIAGENKCEVIFLTNHPFQMDKATGEAKEMMSYSNEVKNTSGVMRYPLKLKRKAIGIFKEEYSRLFNPKTIRYIF